MSAYLCDQDTINAIATYAADHGIVTDAESFAELLTLTNVHAMQTRYPGRDWLEAEVLIPAESYRYERIEVSAERAERAASEYDYQACEATDYELSLCAQLVSRIITHADALAKLERPGGCGAERIKVTCKRCQGKGHVAHRTAAYDARCFCCHGAGFTMRTAPRKRLTEQDLLAAQQARIDAVFPRAAIEELERPGGCGAQRLEATHLRDDRWAVRPQGQLGTCGWSPAPWSVTYVRARNAKAAVLKALDRKLDAIEQLERPGGVGAQRLGIYWTAQERQQKDGPDTGIDDIGRDVSECLSLAKSGCYAKGGNVGILWHALTQARAERGSWKHGAAWRARSIGRAVRAREGLG
jgi:hypothetical protein